MKKSKLKKVLGGIGSAVAIYLLIMGFTGKFDQVAHDKFGYGAPDSIIYEDAGAENIDLYQYRMATEEVITSNLNYEKAEDGIYPSMEHLTFMCMDGSVYMIMLNEFTEGNYTYLGVSVGDNIEDAKSKIANFYTLIDTTTVNGNQFRDSYQDSEYGTLGIDYNMADGKIVSISYVVEDAGASGAYEETDVAEYGIETDIGMTDPSMYNYYDLYYGIILDSASVMGGTCDYTLFDFDGEGTMELIVSGGETNADYINDVYTVDATGNVVGLGSFYGPCLFYETEGGEGVVSVYSHMDHEVVKWYTLENGQLYEEVLFDRNLGPDDEPYSGGYPIPYADAADTSLLESY